MGVTPATPAAGGQGETFTAQPLDEGQLLFPTRLVVSSQRVSRVRVGRTLLSAAVDVAGAGILRG